MSSKTKMTANRVITVVLWIVALYLLFFTSFWYLAAAIFALHTVELFVTAFRRGTGAGYSPLATILMTLVFGYTWWLYLDVK